MKTVLICIVFTLALMSLWAEPSYTDALLQAAQSGNPAAQNDLGLCYLHGYGTMQNEHEAVIWFSSSAEQLYADGQYNLGCCYLEGKGVLQNLPEAKLWLEKAAELGHEQARALLLEHFDVQLSEESSEVSFVPYDDPPVLIGTIRPEYPAAARRGGIQGTVILEVEILKDGNIREVRVKRSVQAGVGGLDEAAIAAVRRVRFQPGKASGRPVDCIVIIPVAFTLQGH